MTTETTRLWVESPIMRLRTFLTAALLLVAARGARAQQVGLKLGFINSQSVLEQDSAFQQAQQQFNQELQSIRTEIQQKEQELDSLIQHFQQQQATLSPQARQQRQQEILTKQQEYQARANELQQQADRRQQEIVQPVMERINGVIEAMRAEGGYALIFDVAPGAILAADQSLDLTDELVRRLHSAPGG
ncbi:MAG TPA: OmpH family outer membrane protein [Longimicrobiales bacterium]|nr:OmpH family outer membrane protein [Longimicrobiales bacterium]